MKEYFDWASDKYSFARWDDSEFMESIDRRMNKRAKRTKNNKRNHKLYA